VTFRYKDDPQAIKQYGLVAEEVDKVYPEWLFYDDAGKVERCVYSMLTSMLLNEFAEASQGQTSGSLRKWESRGVNRAADNTDWKQRAPASRLGVLPSRERLAALEHTIVAQNRALRWNVLQSIVTDLGERWDINLGHSGG